MVVFSLTECSEKSGIKQIYCIIDSTGVFGITVALAAVLILAALLPAHAVV